MNDWLVRKEGAHAAVQLPSVEAVIAALRDGLYDPTDEVKGPTDPAFVRIEAHPALEEAASEVEFYRGEEKDDTHLDMNPLIDVCLVLLIFFILTITYESLKRAIEIPDAPDQKQGPQPIKFESIRDQVVVVQVRMNGDTPVIKVEGKEVPHEQLFVRIKEAYTGKNIGGQKEMVLDVDGIVPWGVQTSVLDAAKGNGVERIRYVPPKTR
jgi:biopolymer transport protein ExbD